MYTASPQPVPAVVQVVSVTSKSYCVFEITRFRDEITYPFYDTQRDRFTTIKARPINPHV